MKICAKEPWQMLEVGKVCGQFLQDSHIAIFHGLQAFQLLCLVLLKSGQELVHCFLSLPQLSILLASLALVLFQLLCVKEEVQIRKGKAEKMEIKCRKESYIHT